MEQRILDVATAWSENVYFDNQFRKEITNLLEKNQQEELADRFYKNLEFGTGGMRGKIGAGSNRMNLYTIQKASQGLADYINFQKKEGEIPRIVIAHDNRHYSDTFTQEASRVFAGNGIQVHVFPSLRPTPMLSFTVRELKATAGIVITASHNPPEYNGYKVYWSDGCQITSPHDKNIIQRVEAIEDFSTIQILDYATALQEKKIELIPDSLDQKYYRLVEELCLGKIEDNQRLGVVYTPLHGTGNQPIREVLKRRGFPFKIVEEQATPDGDFPTVKSPNPEEPSAFAMAQNLASEQDQLILATDPDADRLGAMVKHQGKWIKLTGNQIGQLFLDHYLSALQNKGELPEEGHFITTIVTSELGKKIATNYGLISQETLTGFKYIGEIIRQLESEKGDYVFGMEESHGYLFGDFVRDKDAVSAAVLFSELVAQLLKEKLTPIDQLEKIYQKYGYHEDSLINKVIEGQKGSEDIQKIMKGFRENPPKNIAGKKVEKLRDYQEDQIVNLQSGKILGKTGLPQSNVLAFYMEDGSRITVRPSGTEPKIKFYFNLCGESPSSLTKNRKLYEEEFMILVGKILSI